MSCFIISFSKPFKCFKNLLELVNFTDCEIRSILLLILREMRKERKKYGAPGS